jgi:hypothetical protein
LLSVAAWRFGTLAMFGYDVIVADPPWDFENYSDAGTKKGADPHSWIGRLLRPCFKDLRDKVQGVVICLLARRRSGRACVVLHTITQARMAHPLSPQEVAIYCSRV